MEGPILLKIFSCKNCEHLKKATLFINGSPYTCFHNNVIKGMNGVQLISGRIGKDKVTPEFCPFLFIQERVEKLKSLQIYDENVKK